MFVSFKLKSELSIPIEFSPSSAIWINALPVVAFYSTFNTPIATIERDSTHLNGYHPVDADAMTTKLVDYPLPVRSNGPDEVYTPASLSDGDGLVGSLAPRSTFETRRRYRLPRSRYRFYF